MKRRQFLAAAAALPGAAALSSCAGFTGSSPDSGSDTVSFLTWGTDSELSAFRSAIKGFEAETGTRVEMDAVPFEQMFQNVDARIQAGNPPDVFRVDYDNVGTYASREQLLDLSDLVDADLGDRFTPAMWQAVQHEDRPYGVPHHTDTSAILYNEAALREAGVTAVPTTLEDAWTWEQFRQVAQDLRRSLPDERYPFAYNWQSQGVTRWLSWLFQADGRLLDEALTAPAIDSEAGRRALDFTASFFPDELVPPSSSIKSATYASDLFFGETVAMVFAGSFLLPDADELAEFGWGATFSPRDVRGGSDLGGNALVATAGTERREEAAAFLAYVTEAQQMEDFCVSSSLLPTRRDLVESGIEFRVRPELSPVFIGQASTVQPSDAAQISSASMNAINTVLADELEQAFTAGRGTQPTLDAISSGIEQVLRG